MAATHRTDKNQSIYFAGMRRRAFLLLLMQTSPIYIYWI